jgi:hypothetical protein
MLDINSSDEIKIAHFCCKKLNTWFNFLQAFD